ncbi:unnamed protein product [Clonostachys rosea]|uniref:SH3 domain-containing protein n=1 Tax=Bionectria ochroleuca TaxID=29856 RepID=A0ABY6UHH8_BIOOC|nr:unnamed protein product [Clonostachys rosea]
MAADQGEGTWVPPATEVERVFAEWEQCFLRHKQELQALRSPQQEYQAKSDAIDARISQWWATYDEMSSAQKQQERDSLGLLFAEKSSLAAQHQLTLEAQQATHERRQREVFQRLRTAMDGLVSVGLPGGSKRKRAQTLDRPRDGGSQNHDTARGSRLEAESEAGAIETIDDSRSLFDADDSVEEGHASTSKGNTEKVKARMRKDPDYVPTGALGFRLVVMQESAPPKLSRLEYEDNADDLVGDPGDAVEVVAEAGACWGALDQEVGQVVLQRMRYMKRWALVGDRLDLFFDTDQSPHPEQSEMLHQKTTHNAVKTPILILPLNDMESIGINEDLTTLHLGEDMPKCCLFSSRSKKYQWARGYEDDGRLESSREYPVLCLTSSQLQKCPASWVPGDQMTSIHDDEAGWKLNDHYHEACDVLRKIKARQSQSPARITDDIQSDQGSGPLLEADDSMNTSLHEKPNPNPETSTQPQILPDPNGPSSPEETVSENLGHQDDKVESESTARDAEAGVASKNVASPIWAEPSQAQHESGGHKESYLENLAHTSLDYVRDNFDGINHTTVHLFGDATARDTPPSRAKEQPDTLALASYPPPIADIQAIEGTQIPQPHHTVNPQLDIEDSVIPTDSETTSNVQTEPDAQESSTHTRAQVGEMFNEIERHMAEKQIRVHWASVPAVGLNANTVLPTTPNGYLSATSTDQ